MFKEKDLLFKAWDSRLKIMSDPFRVFQTTLTKDGQPIGTQLPEDLTVLEYLGFNDNNGNQLFKGDVARVAYQDRSSKLFEEMKKQGHDHIHLFFDVDTPYRTLNYRSHDESTYYIGCSIYGDDARFLRYIFGSCKAAEIIGNVYENPELLLLIVPEDGQVAAP